MPKPNKYKSEVPGKLFLNPRRHAQPFTESKFMFYTDGTKKSHRTGKSILALSCQKLSNLNPKP